MTYSGFKLISILTFTMGIAIICVNIYIDNDTSDDISLKTPATPQGEEFAIYTSGCKIPKLDPYHSSVRKYIKDYTGKHLECTSLAMVVANKKILTVNKKHPQYSDDVKCFYKNLTRASEDKTVYGDREVIDANNGSVITTEFVMAECIEKNSTIYQDLFAFIVDKPEVEKRCEKANESLSVLVLGLDSVSKNSYIRHLKLVDEFIRSKLTFVELHGYNKLGLNTYPNLIPFYTGKLEDEYMFNHKNTDLNRLPLIWQEFAQRGYRTLFAEDCSFMSSFNYLKRGFDKAPTDYYMRPFSIAFDGSAMRKHLTEGCFHNRTEAGVIYKWVFDFFDRFHDKPLFAHVFLTRLSHDDYNTIAFYDKPLLELMENMRRGGHLNRTVVFFMSDHGFRFGGIRTTYVGHLEDKLPFFFFLLPDWFPKKYPKYYENLQLNAKRLATPLDMYATLTHIVNDLRETEEDLGSRSLSLFTPVPTNRTCSAANIESQYCTCFERKQIAVDSEWAIAGANVLLKSINERISGLRNYCAVLELNEIVEASAHDVDINRDKKEFYTNLLITFEVRPSNAVFQGIAVYNHKGNEYTTETVIDRLNRYDNQSECITDPELRLFCYCKENLY